MDNRRRMMWKKPPEYAIYYTSTDGNIVTPYTTSGWGAKIISNTYENGVGKILFDKKVTMAPTSAFYSKTTLSSIEFPDSVTSIGKSAFEKCSSLKSFYSKFASEDNRCLIVDGKLIAFAPAGLTEYTIPDSVTSIGGMVFAYCTSLTSVTIPNSVTSIGERAFNHCTELIGDLVLPEGLVTIEQYAFNDCKKLTSITVPKTLNSVGKCAFTNCTGLKKIFIIDLASWCHIDFASMNSNFNTTNPTYYARDIYINNELVTELIIPNEIQYIKPHTFIKCSFTSVVFTNDIVSIGEMAFKDARITGEVVIPDSVTSIGRYAFHGCSAMTRVTIGNGVTEIGERAFSECTSLKSATIGNNVTSIGKHTFTTCSSLTSIVIPDSVTLINSEAFGDCRSLTSIIVSEGNSVYDSRENCNAIIKTATNALVIGCRTTIIPDSVTKIGRSAFAYCKSLTSIVIPDSVTEIGAYSFNYCSSLTSVTIGNGVTSIGEGAFYYCAQLKNIHSLNPTAPTITSNSFYSVASSGVLMCPINSDYSSWMQTSTYYLGYYDWTSQWPYAPQTYYDLSITAQDVIGNSTITTISWTCMSDGVDYITGEPITGIQLSGTATSEGFPQNTSETETVERTITFEYQGLTASTTITQGVWIKQSYELVLNDNWQLSTAVANPDSALYDGVYESFSNYNKNSTAAIMYIDIFGYETFQLYIRSYAESNYDYVMVSQLDQTIDNNSSYSNTTLVKAHTRGTQKSGTAISDYKLVEFTGLDGGEHRITVVYRKDGSGNSGTDKGYLIIPRQ